MKSVLFSNSYNNYFQFNGKVKEMGIDEYMQFFGIEDVYGQPIVFLMNDENLYISIDGETLLPKEKNDPLFGKIIEDYKEHLEITYKVCKDFLDNAEMIEYDKDKFSVNIYGKIYGGIYNHPEVPKIPDTTPITMSSNDYTEYCPMNDFMVYDIQMMGAFLNYEVMKAICDESGLDTGSIIHFGGIESFVNKLEGGQTTIPKRFGLPEIEGNDMHGMIIRPAQTIQVSEEGDVLVLKKELFDVG